MIERSKWFKQLGLSQVRYDSGTRFVLQKGHIAGAYPASFTSETQNRLFRQFESLVHWLSKNSPGDLERLLPNGRFRYDATSAIRWLEVVEEWKRRKPATG